MRILKSQSKNMQEKMKFFYSGVALAVLMTASSLSYAMDEGNDEGHKLPRIRTLLHLGQKAHTVPALNILDKETIDGKLKNNPKARIKYLKELSEFFKKYPDSSLTLKILESANEGEESLLSKFYKETLVLAYSSLPLVEKDYQILRAKIFFSRLPQTITKVDSDELKTEINKSYFSLMRKMTVEGKEKLKFLKIYYMGDVPDKKSLEDFSVQLTENQRLAGKINFKLGQIASTNPDEKKRLSQQLSFYGTAAKRKYSRGMYHLAELYNLDSEINKSVSNYHPELAYENYIDAADLENPLAAYALAKLLETGDPTFDLQPDKEDALMYMKQAAKEGHPYAQYDLAKYHMENQEWEKGVELLQQSAEAGYAKAQFDLAKIYEEGNGDLVQKNAELAEFWYQKAVDQEEKSAYLPLARILKIKGEPGKAYDLFTQSPDSAAQRYIGIMLKKGEGGTKNETSALKHFEEGIRKGDMQSNYYLGKMFIRGQGDNPDHPTAFSYFTEAVKAGFSKANYWLGLMAQYGLGTPQSYKEAKEYYEKADTPDALYHLGWIHKQGLGIEKNPALALSFWEKAAEAGLVHKNAAYKAGKFHLKEWQRTNDETSAQNAQKYLEKAGESHSDALYLLGLLNEKLGNPMVSHKFYDEASKLGHAPASFELGEFNEKTLTEEGRVKALEYYERAVSQNHVGARLALARLSIKGDHKEKDRAFSLLQGLESEIFPSILSSMKAMAKEGYPYAIAWFEEHAQKGNSYAQKYVAKILEMGTLVPQNISKAAELYQKASEKGDRSAKRRLDDLKKAHLLEALSIKEKEEATDLSNKSSEDELDK